jgi:hypothetical protein
VHESKKGGAKDAYLLDAATSDLRDEWVKAFKCAACTHANMQKHVQ